MNTFLRFMEGVAEPDESPALRMNLLHFGWIYSTSDESTPLRMNLLLSSNRISLRSAVLITSLSMPRSPSDRVHLRVVTAAVYAVLSYSYDTYMLYPLRSLSFPH